LDIERYKQRLQKEEKQLLDGIEEEVASIRESGAPEVGDAADQVISGELKEEQAQDVKLNRSLLLQVREALQRIDNGTYGRCLVDGGPIDEKRLDAMPWTPYCIEHQRPLEAANPVKAPTL
jgi:DnaK suppressor protein